MDGHGYALTLDQNGVTHESLCWGSQTDYYARRETGQNHGAASPNFGATMGDGGLLGRQCKTSAHRGCGRVRFSQTNQPQGPTKVV